MQGLKRPSTSTLRAVPLPHVAAPAAGWSNRCMDWQRVARDFEADGSLRDIYVQGTGLNDWQNVVDALRESWPSPAYTLDGEPAALPRRVEAIFDAPREQAALLSLAVGDARVTCHFFVEDEIEFSVDPREIAGPAQVEALTEFMALLGRATGKTVMLTLENAPEAVIFRYSVEEDEVIWVESSPGRRMGKQ
jgi:hypothetical protein